MSQFNSFDEKRHTAIYVRISTASQKTDRQQEELTSFAELNQLNFNRNLFSEKKYGCWLVNNDSHRFFFDRESRMFSEIRSGRVLGKYTFEEFDQLTQERGMVGEFSPYEFNIDKQ